MSSEKAGFERAREQRESEVAEDYVRLIDELIHTAGFARTADIVEKLGVAQPTVTKTLARLEREGLVIVHPRRAIMLTEAGSALAARVRLRRRLVVAFLRSIGVDAEESQLEAESLEHRIGEKTMAAMLQVVESYFEEQEARCWEDVKCVELGLPNRTDCELCIEPCVIHDARG